MPKRFLISMEDIHLLRFGHAKRAWVERVTGFSDQGLERERLDPAIDYSGANSKGTRGVMLYYFLADGVYEISKPISHKTTDRFFGLVNNGNITRIKIPQVVQWLNDHSE